MKRPKWREVKILYNSGFLWEKHCCGECEEHCYIWVRIDHPPPTTCEEVKEKNAENGWK